MAPRVSVCIPAFRAGATLGETLASVLGQSYTDFEVLVVDDQSDDDTVDVARSFGDPRLRVERNDLNLGMVGNYNRVVDGTSGELVKLVCADDILRPDCLEAQVAVLDGDPGLALTACRRDIVDISGRVVSPNRGIPTQLAGSLEGRQAVRRIVRSGYNPVGEPASVLFRRSARELAGGFSDRLVGPCDLDLWIRLLRHGDFFGDTRTLAAFRIHAGSATTAMAREVGSEDRQLFRLTAADPHWALARTDLWSGLLRSRAHGLYRRARIARVNSANQLHTAAA